MFRRVGSRITTFIILFIVIVLIGAYFCTIDSESNKYAYNTVSDMFMYNGSLYYTNQVGQVFRYVGSADKDEVVSKDEHYRGSETFEDNGFIYYSDWDGIYQKNLKTNINVKLIKGENTNLAEVGENKLFYAISYKDSSGKGFSEFEYRVYEIDSGREKALLKRSLENWYLREVSGNTLLASSYSEKNEDKGLYAIDISSGIKKKLCSNEIFDGCLLGDMYYFASSEGGLWSINIKEGKANRMAIPGMEDIYLSVSRVIGYKENLYFYAHYKDKDYIVKLDLETKDVSILKKDIGRVWHIITDGKTLYSYSMKYYKTKPRAQYINAISLE